MKFEWLNEFDITDHLFWIQKDVRKEPITQYRISALKKKTKKKNDFCSVYKSLNALKLKTVSLIYFIVSEILYFNKISLGNMLYFQNKL